MTTWLSILGRQPELSLAELESCFGAGSVTPLSTDAAEVDAPKIDIDRLGGSQKIGKVLADLNGLRIDELPSALVPHLPKSDHKINFGLSLYGTKQSGHEVGRLALTVKKLAKKNNIRLRTVPNPQPSLSTAQVMHNQLTREDNVELMAAFASQKVILARTIGVQNIDAYRQRDVERPARDARVGMLPPKLAQIMLNLARVEPGQTVLDPFAGTGVVLQEALLLGAGAYGSDISERMVKMCESNLLWLAKHHSLPSANYYLEAADARIRRWLPPVDAVVSELHLGPPLFRPPAAVELKKIQTEADSLLRDFLKNLQPQLASGTRLVLAIPAWQVAGRLHHLTSVDQIETLGYNPVSLKHAQQPLVYVREDQIVARQLLVLEKQ